jgi:pimeloyl-ACP methyl ester carboxylesterase
VTIVTGDSDNLVAPTNSAYIKKYMEEAEYLVFEETGHAINVQRKKRYNELLERTFAEGREMARNVDT